MFPDEHGLRQALTQRAFRSPEEIWPGIRRKLVRGEVRRSRAVSWAIIVAALIVTLAIFLGRSGFHRQRIETSAFGVSNVRSLGRPATPIVLRPDSRTLMVIVD